MQCEAFPASEVARLRRRVSAVEALDLAVLGLTVTHPTTALPVDAGHDVEVHGATRPPVARLQRWRPSTTGSVSPRPARTGPDPRCGRVPQGVQQQLLC